MFDDQSDSNQGWWSRINFNGSAPAPEQGFQYFLALTAAPELAIFLLWIRLRLLLI